MPRIRTVKPTHWNDKELPKISLNAHLLWIATWNFSDDEGVFEGDPLLLKSQIFPRRTDIRVDQIKSWLDQLVKARFVLPFQYKGEGYYVSRTFKTHQRIDKPQDGIIPPDVLSRVFQECSENVPRTLLPVEESIVEESSVCVGGGEPPTRTPEDEEFLEVVHWLKDKAPRVMKMAEPVTREQYFKLKKAYGPDALSKIFMAMHNWKDLTKKRVSAYLTFISFIKRDQEQNAA